MQHRPLALAALLVSASLLAPAAALAQDASEDPPQATPASGDRAEKLAILEAYLDALVDGDFGSVPMTDDVQFQNPYMSEPISGEETVQAYEEKYFSSTIDAVQDGVIYIIDGDDATAIFVLEMTKGWTVPTADYFHFEDGEIALIKPYFDTAIFETDPTAAE